MTGSGVALVPFSDKEISLEEKLRLPTAKITLYRLQKTKVNHKR
jgi:hypothetical protein